MNSKLRLKVRSSMSDLRADLVLVERGLAASRTTAQRLITTQRVFLEHPRRLIDKPSYKIPRDAELFIQPDESDRYVSRGGLKLAGALQHTQHSVRDLHAVDIGMSTGGFSDCLLQNGCATVVGVDVGHQQLAAKLASDPRITLFEGFNIRHHDLNALINANQQQLFDFAVCDVSFISLRLILQPLAALLKPNAHALILVKPQFEVGSKNLARGGIVRKAKLYPLVQSNICTCARQHGLNPLDYFESPITGGDGNHEFFLYAQRLKDSPHAP